jgi:hypothetical protein
MKTKTLARVGLVGALAALFPLAHAFEWPPDAFTVQTGAGEHSVRMMGAGRSASA